MNTFLDEIGAYISDQGAATPGTDLFYDQLPGTPYVCIALFLTGGPRVAGSPKRVYSFQIIIRNTNPTTARETALAVHALFDDVVSDRTNCNLPSYEGRFEAQHEPGIHVVDENNHFLYSLNYHFVTTTKHAAS